MPSVDSVESYFVLEARKALQEGNLSQCLSFTDAAGREGGSRNEAQLIRAIALMKQGMLDFASKSLEESRRAISNLESAWEILERLKAENYESEAVQLLLRTIRRQALAEGGDVESGFQIERASDFIAKYPRRGVATPVMEVRRHSHAFPLQVYELSDVVIVGHHGCVVDCMTGAVMAESFAGVAPSGIKERHFAWLSQKRLSQTPYFEAPLLHLCGMWSANFFHWIHEQLPKILFAIEMNYSGYYLIPEAQHPFIRETFELLGIPSERIIPFDSNQGIASRTCLVFDALPAVSLRYNLSILENIRSVFLSRIPHVQEEHRRGVYIQRRGSRAVEEEETLLRLFEGFPVEVVQAEQLSLKQQVELAASTSVLIGPHGSGLTHSLFMPPESSVIELLPVDDFNPCFEPIRALLSHRYYTVPSVPAAARMGSTTVLPYLPYVKSCLEQCFT